MVQCMQHDVLSVAITAAVWESLFQARTYVVMYDRTIGLVTGCCRVEHGELSKSQYKAGYVHNTGNSHLHSACSQFTIVSLSLLCMLYPLPSFRLSLKIHVIAALKLQNFFFLLFLNIITLLLYYWVSIEENKTW